MASLGNHHNMNISQCGVGGRHISQSGMPIHWRSEPLIPSIRQFIMGKIADYLAKGATPMFGVYGPQISQLSAEFENKMFSTALSKEDYMNGDTFVKRLSSIIQEKYYGSLSPQQTVTYATPSVFPTFAAPSPTEHLKCNTSPQLFNAVNDFIVAPSTPLSFASADYTCGSQLSPDVMHGSQANHFNWGRKRTHMTTSLSDQVTTNAPFLVDGIPSINCGDSNLTYSGSVLQYESEASLDSNCRTQHVIEAEHDPVTSATTKPTSDMHSQISAGGDRIKILSTYIKFKLEPETSCLGQDLFLQYVHVNTCNYGCACDTLKSQLDHIDQCLSRHCRFCSSVIYYHNDQARNKRFNSRIHNEQTPYENIALTNSSPVAPELCHTPSKLRKLNSCTSIGIPVSRSYPVSLELSPKQEQYSEPLLCSNSGDTELNMETDTPDTELNMETDTPDTELNMETDTPNTQYSGSICDSKIDVLEEEAEERRFCSENTSPISGDFVDCKQNEVEPTVNNEVKDKALESLSSPSSKCLTTSSEYQCTSQTNDDGVRNSLKGTVLPTTAEPLETTRAVETCSTSIKLKMQGVSLTEFFTPEVIKQHVWSLKQNIDQTVPEQEIGNTTNNCISENYCQLCNMDKLWFPPMPIYCSPCGSRIKCRGTYYSMLDENGAQACFCSACYNKSRGPKKSKMEMKKNDVVTEESWVQCDICEGWQHQICALFNDKRDFGGKTEYICPNCYLAELETGECKPLPWTSCFGARNLPRTVLSDHLEQRLFDRLEKDREDRVKAAGKDLDEVLVAADLTVRVVSSVNKVLKVKQQFQDIFPDKSYPAEFPYRSKVVLLFQKIEGVDVCLFGMYVQEFGSQCSRPNQRCIYISYLDSVKYFRPEAKSVAGEALRTFVYHEILIGYLDYCKKRGFSTCYIWACPPVKGEDYILYCHPEVQKTPKPDKLRQWYRSMLRKAANEKIIVNSSNIYEQFFVPNEGCNTKVTAARLPYFDGDYWSSVADSMIKKIEKECGGDLQKKVKKMTRRSLKAMGHTDPLVTEGDAKDILLMHELGQTLSSAKEDFIIVYLQFICTHCHEVIASGKRWYCSQCKNFQLCEGCHGEDQNPENTHISSSGQKHVLSQEAVNGVPADTEDNDAIMNNCFLENRHALLSFCQGNHYQFDTLRRAKHSSMMILYHLHHPYEDTAGTTCSLCLKDVAVDRQWKCNLCPDFIVCGACYQRNGVGCHTHNLSQNLALPNPPVEPNKAKMVQELLDVVLHSSKCQATITETCNYTHCHPLRKLFAHTRLCTARVAGGCVHCKKAWLVIKMHSLRCGDSNCNVPRCRDLKRAAEPHDLENETKPPDTSPEPIMQ